MDRISRARQGTKIADVLESKEWSEIDFALRQFGFQTESIWNGTPKAYVLEMLHSGTDEDISELAVYLGCSIEGGAEPTPNAEIWDGVGFRVFLSHLSKHKAFAADLQARLGYIGVGAFVAHSDIQPTEEWVTQIEAALSSCDVLVALMHPGFHESLWTDQEIGFVMGRGKPVFSVRLGTDPYGFIGRFQAIPAGDGSPTQIAEAIFDSALSNKKTQEHASECLISALCASKSWDMSNRLVGYLPKLQAIKSDWPDRLHKAFGSNYELNHAFNVPSAFRAFFSRAGRNDLEI